VPHVRPWTTVESALRASDEGVPDRDNAELHGVAIKTIRRWRREYQRRGKPRGQAHTSVPCPRCDGRDLNAAAYAELFGWYCADALDLLGLEWRRSGPRTISVSRRASVTLLDELIGLKS